MWIEGIGLGCARGTKQHDRLMDEVAGKATTVVVATDGSPAAMAAVDWAATEAASRRAPLLVFTAFTPVQVPASSLDESAAAMTSLLDSARLRSKENAEIVSAAADRARSRHPELVVTTEIFEGDPRRALEWSEHQASVVVLGSRGLGSVKSALLGSVSFWATRHLTVPFVVVRPPDPERLSITHGIAVGITSDASSELTLRQAFALAQRRGCPLTIANAAWDSEATANHWRELAPDDVDPARRRAVTELAEQIARDFPGVSYRVLFARGRVDGFLVSLSRTHEALVLGRRTSTLLDFIGLGTLASAVVEHGAGAIVVIPIEGAHS